MERNEACEVLGVRKNASRDEIARKYSILLKKRSMTENDGGSAEEIDMEKVTTAYNLLMGYEEPKVEEVPSKASPIFKKAGIDEKKARNFWHYYKFHVLGGIALLLVIVFSLKSCLTAEKPDFNLAFIGNIYFSENEALRENIKKSVPLIKTPSIDGAILSEEGGDAQQQYAMQMKAMVLLAAADVDLFIVDKDSFDRYGKQGAYLSLDPYVDKLGVDKSALKDFVIKPEDAEKEELYGIDISKSKLLKDSNIIGESMVVAIPVKSKHIDTALELIKTLLQE
jgi:hypothetical protein